MKMPKQVAHWFRRSGVEHRDAGHRDAGHRIVIGGSLCLALFFTFLGSRALHEREALWQLQIGKQADIQRSAQVMANLLSNAAKFSPVGGSVVVRLQHRGEVLRVSVADSGPGIPEAFKSRIFSKFSQADSGDTRQQGGTGLVLAICKEIIERMGGHIGFDSSPGQGATFWFELPITGSAS